MKRIWMPIVILLLAACICMAQEEAMLLHSCEDTTDIRVEGPEETTKLRVNVEVPNISEGEGSLHLFSRSPEDPKGNTYASMIIPINPVDLRDKALVFDAWTSSPETTGALYVRGIDPNGGWAASWNNWKHPLTEEKTTFVLIPERDSKLQWDEKYVASDDRSSIEALRFYIGTSTGDSPMDLYLDNIRLVPVEVVQKQPVTLHTADTTDNVKLSTGSDLPEATLQVAKEPENVTEGTGSLHASATSPEEFEKSAYLSMDVNIAPTDMTHRVLTFDAWTSTPEYSRGFYVRGYDSEGNTVMSYKNWSGILTAESQHFVLHPGRNSAGMAWEAQEIESEDASGVVTLRFYVGTRDKAAPMDVFVDNITATSAEKLSETPVVLHTCETIEGMSLDRGAEGEDAVLELNTDPAFISEGQGSVHIARTSEEDAQGNSYISVDIPVPAADMTDRKLTFDAWTTEPENTDGFYVRGYDAAEKCVLSWNSWSNPVKAEKTHFEMIPGVPSAGMGWESAEIEADHSAPVVRLRFYAATHDPATFVDLYIDNIRAEHCEVVSFMDVNEPKNLYVQTPIVQQGEPRAVIVSPAAEAWVDLANELSESIREATGVSLPVAFSDEISDEELQSTNTIMLGDVNANRSLLYPYSHGLVFADGGYPGEGGFDLRSVHDPWGTGHNIISIGASDIAGARAGMETLVEMSGDEDDLVLGRIHHVELSDTARNHWRNIFTQTLDDEWFEGWKDRCNNHLVTAGTRGLFSMAQGVGRDYAITRREPYAKLFVWMIKRTYENYLSDPDTYGGPWGMDSDFHIYQVIPAWDAVEEAPNVSDEDRLEVTKILFQWVSEVGAPKGKSSNDHVRHNHKTFPALGCLYAGQYFKRHYDAIEGQNWIDIADETFKPQIEATKPHEDCNSYQWLTLYHVFRYCLARPDLTYFENDHARLNADYAILTMNNLGYQVPYGDIGGWAVMGGEMRILRAAEWYYGTGRYQWVLDKKMGRNPRASLGDFEPDTQQLAKPDDIIGAHIWPVDEGFYRSWDGDNWVDMQHAFDKVAFRDGFEPDDQYLLLDGLSAGGHGHMDGNAVLQWTENGRVWLADVDYIKSLPKYHNTLLILKDGQSEEPPEFCSLQNFTDLDTLAASHTVAEDYAGGDWHRYVVWPKGRMFIVVDRVRANEAGDYSLRAVWQTLGEVELDGANLDINQDGQYARFAMTPDTGCMVTNDEETGANWSSYPWAEDSVVRVMQGIRNTSLAEGESATLFTALHASGEQASGVEVTRIADNIAAITGDGDPVLVGVPDETGRIQVGETLQADADLLVMSGEKMYAAGLREIRFAGQAYTPPETVDVEVDLASGEAVLHSPAVTDAVTESFEQVEYVDIPVSVEQIEAMVQQIIAGAPEPETTGVAVGDVPQIPERWRYMDLPETLLLTGNSNTFGAVDAGMEYSVSPEPLEANVFSGATGANTPKNIFDGATEGTGGATMWDDEQQVTMDISFDRVCDIEDIILRAWFATSSSKNKQFQLGELKVLASNDGFEADTRTLVDLKDEEMHGSWGAPGHAPHRYAFEAINEAAKDLRLIFTPRPGTAMYIAELQVWGTAEGLAAEATDQGEALNPFTCLHTADIDGDGSDETLAGSEAGFVYCVDADGNLVWKFDTQNTVNAVSTVDFNGDGTRTVVAGGISGRLFALDNDGNEKWIFQMPHYKSVGHINTVFAADLAGDGNEIAVAGGDNWRYYAVDANGEEIWHYESVHSSTAGAAADLDGDGKDEVIAGTEYYWWHCVNPDGSRRWGCRTAGGPDANDVTTGDLDGDGTLEVLFGGADTLVQAVSTDGDHLWTFSTGDEVQTVICEDINGDGKDEILAASLSFNVYCLDGEGNLLWRQDLGRPVNDITAFEGEAGWNVMAACDDGNAYLLEGSTGNIYGAFETGGSVTDVEAAVYDGDIQIIAASEDGYLYGLGRR